MFSLTTNQILFLAILLGIVFGLFKIYIENLSTFDKALLPVCTLIMALIIFCTYILLFLDPYQGILLFTLFTLFIWFVIYKDKILPKYSAFLHINYLTTTIVLLFSVLGFGLPQYSLAFIVSLPFLPLVFSRKILVKYIFFLLSSFLLSLVYLYPILILIFDTNRLLSYEDLFSVFFSSSIIVGSLLPLFYTFELAKGKKEPSKSHTKRIQHETRYISGKFTNFSGLNIYEITLTLLINIFQIIFISTLKLSPFFITSLYLSIVFFINQSLTTKKQ